MSSNSDILLEEKNGVGWITLNRPKAMNALNLSMIRSMYPKLKEWESGAVQLVVIKGVGDKAFCAGGDIRSLTEVKGGKEQKSFFREEYMLDDLVGNLGIPYLAILNGIVMGGGVGISLHGTYRVCCENTVFAMPETGIGLVPDVGGAYFLPRLNGSLGMFLGLTGHRLKGRDCLHAGLATHAVNKDDISSLEAELSGNPGQAKQILDDFAKRSTFDAEKEFSLASHLETIDRIFSKPTVEEIVADLGKEESEFAQKALKIMKKASPSSLKVAQRQISEGKRLENLSQCLNMEYRLVMRCCENDDFYEGVRALLIDRDNAPKWSPATLEGVSEDLLNSYFQPLPETEELNL